MPLKGLPLSKLGAYPVIHRKNVSNIHTMTVKTKPVKSNQNLLLLVPFVFWNCCLSCFAVPTVNI